MAEAKRVTIVWQGDSGQTFNLTIDAAGRVQHSSPNTVTDHPVETGSAVADHIRPEADTVTIDGVISNTPIFLPGDHVGSARETIEKITKSWSGRSNKTTVHGAQNTIGDVAPVPRLISAIPIGGGESAQIGRTTPGGNVAANVKAFTQDFDRAAECYAELLRLRNEGRLARVLTARREYDDMAITSLDVTDEGKTGNALRFSVSFKHVRFGSTKNEPVPEIPRKKVNKGRKTKQEPAVPVESEEDASVLHGLVH